jgi:hypothetical protein
MNKKVNWLFLSFATLQAATGMFSPEGALAGDGVGNGGVSVVCRYPNGRIKSAELLDLFEAKLPPYNLSYSSASTDIETRLELVQLKMVSNQKFLLDFQSELPKVRTKILPMPRDVGIEPTNDAFPMIHKKGCKFEQVANYAEDGNIYLDQEIFDAMDELNQAALYAHETIYSIARTNVGELSSKRSRQLTAQVLASNGTTEVIRGLMTQLVEAPKSVPAPALTTAEIEARIDRLFPVNKEIVKRYEDPSGRGCPVKVTIRPGDVMVFDVTSDTLWNGDSCEDWMQFFRFKSSNCRKGTCETKSLASKTGSINDGESTVNTYVDTGPHSFSLVQKKVLCTAGWSHAKCHNEVHQALYEEVSR